MTPHCQPLPRSLAEEMLQVVARAMCDRPADSAAQRESRTRQMVHSTLGFEPRDGLEYMLSTIAFGHFQLILDSMRDVFQGQTDAMKARTKTTIVALDRAMLEMIRELRAVRRRPVARSAEESRREETRPPSAAPLSPEMPAAEPVIAMPVAGMLSEEEPDRVAEAYRALRAAADEVMEWRPPYRTFKAIQGTALACNAGPHLTDLGLTDGGSGEIMSLLIEKK